jgi:hypothetical protein
MSSNVIRWYVSAELDVPELKSPQPCPRGVNCDYKIKGEDGQWTPACCRFVHPGEEGSGRKLFPARTVQGRTDPACVRLINAPYYERRFKKMSWPAWTAYVKERDAKEKAKAKPAFEAVTIQPINAYSLAAGGGAAFPPLPQAPKKERVRWLDRQIAGIGPEFRPPSPRELEFEGEETVTVEYADTCHYCVNKGCDGDHSREQNHDFSDVRNS